MCEPNVPSSRPVVMDIDLVIAGSILPNLVANLLRKIEQRGLEGVGFGAAVCQLSYDGYYGIRRTSSSDPSEQEKWPSSTHSCTCDPAVKSCEYREVSSSSQLLCAFRVSGDYEVPQNEWTAHMSPS
jgi:hypothetical protein